MHTLCGSSGCGCGCVVMIFVVVIEASRGPVSAADDFAAALKVTLVGRGLWRQMWDDLTP